jgi:hypothetical protein
MFSFGDTTIAEETKQRNKRRKKKKERKKNEFVLPISFLFFFQRRKRKIPTIWGEELEAKKRPSFQIYQVNSKVSSELVLAQLNKITIKFQKKGAKGTKVLFKKISSKKKKIVNK